MTTRMNEVSYHGKTFREIIKAEIISRRVDELAGQINKDLAGKEIIFLGILNGSFIFAADLFRRIELPARISFVKLASYIGTGSTGVVKELIGWNEDLSGLTVVVIEDIIDTGGTIEQIVKELVVRKAGEVKIATCFFKPDVYSEDIEIDYIGFEIPDDFIIGYGLDFNGFGRNLPSVYSLVP
jgi:hypoxanthine phosphoribosyltransferase